MVNKRINNILVVIIILLSTSLYEFSALGPLQKVAELAGVGLIIMLLAFHLVYADQKHIPHLFSIGIFLIFCSLITSMFMASYSRGQNITDTLYAQRGIYFYLFYFLLHQMKIKPRDLEIIFISFGILYVIFYLIQYSVYPTVLFDAYVRLSRGTVRIYLEGSAYLTFAYLISVQGFFRTTKFSYLLLLLMFFGIFVLTGGRQVLAIMILILILFLVFDRKVKSRLTLFFLTIGGSIMVYFIFEGIINTLILKSRTDANLGEDYIRIQAAKFFLTDFFKNSLSYITGNGMYSNDSSYGAEIRSYMSNNGYFLGDIGIIGIYAIYGLFFVAGVILMFVNAFKIKIQSNYSYIKYIFLAILLSVLTSGAFSQGSFICYLVGSFYLMDLSNNNLKIKNNASSL